MVSFAPAKLVLFIAVERLAKLFNILQLRCRSLSLHLMKLHINWNVLGLSAVIICAIHCALFPLLISSLPMFGIALFDNIYFEWGMITLAIAIGSVSLWHGYRRHHHRMVPLFSFYAGMIFLVLNHFYRDKIFWFILPSTLLIIFAYFLNWRFCRLAKHCHATDCNH